MKSEEIIRICKENAGLRVGYEKYKRRYQSINSILRRELSGKIEALSVQEGVYYAMGRAAEKDERMRINEKINFLSKERADLKRIYEMCIEVGK